MLGELECVREEVLENLIEELTVRGDAGWNTWTGFDGELETLLHGHRPERTLGKLLDGLHRVRLEMGLDAARFDLRQVENLVDEGQEVPPSGVNRRRPLLLLVAQVHVLVRGKHLRE